MELQGYEMFTINRLNRKGGGVALYIDNALVCTKVENMCDNVEDMFECLTVEINIKKNISDK